MRVTQAKASISIGLRSPVPEPPRGFCHVSRHLRCVALVELLIDHPACMMRIAMRA